MALQILINGADHNYLVGPGSVSVPDRIGERSEATFDLIILAGGYHPQPFDAVTINRGGSLVFAGFVWDVDESYLVGANWSAGITLSVRCVDNHLIADRRIVAETYDNRTAGYIVADLLAKYLAADGITAGTVQAGPTITRAVFSYQNVAKCLDELAELAGFYWNISHSRVLTFVDRSANLAPWPMDESARVRNIKVRNHREQYRNRQYIRAGHDKTDVRVETFKGDGAAKTFTLAFPVAKLPTVTVNGATKTVGIRGLDTGRDFYWQKGDAVISQDDGGTPLVAADTLAVTYQGLFPIVVVAEDLQQVNSRALAESTTGIYESLDHASDIDDANAALGIAQAKLTKYAQIDGSIEFETMQDGLAAGQLLSVSLPMLGLNSTDYLIEEVDFSDIGLGQADLYQYRVKAIFGTVVGSWVKFFKTLANQGKTFVIRDNEVLVRLKALTDGVVLGDSMSYTHAPPVTTVGSATVGYAEVG